MSSNPDSLLPQVIAIARKAADVILPYYKALKASDIRKKTDDSPVTDADLAANHVIYDALKALTPELPVLSEESDCPDFLERKQWSRYWLVDPLDGTRGFIRQSPEFTVNIALIENNKPVLGVIVQPVGGDCFYAALNRSAYFQAINMPPMLLSAHSASESYLRLLTGHFDHSASVIKQHLPKNLVVEFIRLNSSIKFARLAQGEGDLYCRFGATSEWDTAAGHCILNESGGAVVDFQGNSLQYNAKSSLINPSFLAVSDKTKLADYLAIIDSLRREF